MADSTSCVWINHGTCITVKTCCFSQVTSRMESRTICIQGGSHTILPSSRPAVSTRSHLGWKVVPSAFMEALMQYFQAAGFSEEVLDSLHSYETLKAALFAGWAPERGIDPLVPAAAQVPSFPLKGAQHNASDGQGLPVLPGFGTQSYRQG